MGLFKRAKDAMEQGQQMAQQAMQDSGGIDMASAGGMQAGLDARASFEETARENNRILGIGQAATATIKGHTDTGEQMAGNAVWMLEVEVAPEVGEPYTITKREVVPPTTMSSYADGTTLPCKIDPEDPNKIAFGDKPFM